MKHDAHVCEWIRWQYFMEKRKYQQLLMYGNAEYTREFLND